MTMHRFFAVLLLVAGLAAPLAAQQVETRVSPKIATAPVGVGEALPLAPVPGVRSAPFSAEAVTEFTQVLGDGNRIERRYSSTIARDSQGRTRREEEIALVGPLAVDGASPRLVTILDTVAGASYTLDERQRIAYRSQVMLTKHRWVHTQGTAQAGWAGEYAAGRGVPHVSVVVPNQTLLLADAASSKVTQESLGTRSIEGVMAEGMRTTSTIPSGAIGNVMPIDVVTERWYSTELQMPVLMTRRDPRSGESVYRLTNIVRAEPPQDLFTIPPDYQVRQGELDGIRMLKKLEAAGRGGKKQ